MAADDAAIVKDKLVPQAPKAGVLPGGPNSTLQSYSLGLPGQAGAGPVRRYGANVVRQLLDCIGPSSAAPRQVGREGRLVSTDRATPTRISTPY
jgi:hypothetical protein